MKPGGWRRSRARGERINMGSALWLSGFRHEAAQDAAALFGDHDGCVPLLREAGPLQVLKGDPIQLTDLELAVRHLLQGPLLGQAEAGNGIFHAWTYPAPVWRALRRAGAMGRA